MAPTSSTLNGWLTTKKRGRDDAQIQADQRKALAALKHKKTKPKKVMPAKRRKDDSSVESDFIVNDDDDDDDDSMEEFIVDDEDDDAKESSDHEELEIVPGVDDDDDDSSASSNVATSFLPRTKLRTTKPSEALSRASKAVQAKRLPALTTTMTTANKRAFFATATNKAKKKQTSPSLSSEEEYLTSPSPLKTSNKDVISIHSGSGSSSDDENDKPTRSKFFGKQKQQSQNKRKLDSLQRLSHNDDDDDDLSVPEQASKPSNSSCQLVDTPEPLADTHQKKKTMVNRQVVSLLLEDTPPPTKATSNKKSKNPFATFAAAHHPFNNDDDDDDSTDEDERIAIQQATKASLKDTTSSSSNMSRKIRIKEFIADESDDDDDDKDLARAIEKSKRDAQKRKKKTLRQAKRHVEKVLNGDVSEEEEEEEEPLVQDLVDSSSEDEGDDNDKDDVVYSEEQKVATSVLETAEALSTQVLKCMNQWTLQQQGKQQTADSTTGMIIVDGAISLGSVQVESNNTSSNSSSWISQETIKAACPGVTLASYQLIGVNWMALLHGMKCDMEGKATPVNGVLADEMGLGKTVQTIAFLAWLKHQRKKEGPSLASASPHLIVVPVSVLPNWMREFETFCPGMKVIKYHGSQAERDELKDELYTYLPGNKSHGKLDVILAPVTYFQKEKSDDRRFLNKFKFDYLVVDEAHMLKNAQSTRYRTLDKISTKHRLLLTGTPVQNSPQELLNMLCFIMPLFSKGSSAMDEDGKDNGVGERMLQHFVDVEMAQSGDEQAAYRKLKQLFAPFVLRRKKNDVIAQLLPPKEQIVEYVELDAAAREVYDSIVKAHVDKNGTKITAAIGDHLFTNLRKAAHHPLLLRTRHNSPTEIEHLISHFHKYKAFQGDGSTKERVAEELAKFNDFQIHLTALELIEENRHRRSDLERYILEEEALFSSAKFARLRTLLPKLIANGHRILIFSGWTSCLDLLGCLMEHLELQYLRMDGSCASDVRQNMIDEFNQNDKIQVFLLSTRACGLGINLTSADTCIMHDLDFNPFNDLQAEDRCHRIGQKKKVTIYKLVAQNTVDADIYEMQERKSKMNAAILESSEAKNERKVMLQAAINRFLVTSPQGKKNPAAKNGKDKENHYDDKETCLL